MYIGNMWEIEMEGHYENCDLGRREIWLFY